LTSLIEGSTYIPVSSPKSGNAGAVAPSEVTAALRKLRLVPVIVIDDSLKAPALASALIKGGLPCAEITFRTPRALEALRLMADHSPDLIIGAGTVLSPRQAADARAAGARFIVAPGFNRSVVDYCLANGIPVYPGVCTPTEIEAALDAGLRELKFFPAEAMGGVAYLKAVSAPYVGVEFMPTGGITPSNIGSYLALPNVIACGGSWLAPADLISEEKFDVIRDNVRAAVKTVRGE